MIISTRDKHHLYAADQKLLLFRFKETYLQNSLRTELQIKVFDQKSKRTINKPPN